MTSDVSNKHIPAAIDRLMPRSPYNSSSSAIAAKVIEDIHFLQDRIERIKKDLPAVVRRVRREGERFGVVARVEEHQQGVPRNALAVLVERPQAALAIGFHIIAEDRVGEDVVRPVVPDQDAVVGAAAVEATVPRSRHTVTAGSSRRRGRRNRLGCNNFRAAWRGAILHQHVRTLDACAQALGGYQFDRWRQDEAIRLWLAALEAFAGLEHRQDDVTLLADARLVLEPDLERSAPRGLGDRGGYRLDEVFLNASWASGSVFGWRGRTESRR